MKAFSLFPVLENFIYWPGISTNSSTLCVFHSFLSSFLFLIVFVISLFSSLHFFVYFVVQLAMDSVDYDILLLLACSFWPWCATRFLISLVMSFVYILLATSFYIFYWKCNVVWDSFDRWRRLKKLFDSCSCFFHLSLAVFHVFFILLVSSTRSGCNDTFIISLFLRFLAHHFFYTRKQKTILVFGKF